METHSFTLILSGPTPLEPERLDALFEAGCGDALFGEQDGNYFADFHREATSFGEAVGSAIRAVEKAVPELKVIRVEREALAASA